MKRIRKYRKGRRLTAVEAVEHLIAGHYIMVHRSGAMLVDLNMARYWSLGMFLELSIHAAEITEEWKEKHQ